LKSAGVGAHVCLPVSMHIFRIYLISLHAFS